jgi:hypothetical protein
MINLAGPDHATLLATLEEAQRRLGWELEDV